VTCVTPTDLQNVISRRQSCSVPAPGETQTSIPNSDEFRLASRVNFRNFSNAVTALSPGG
jgi:hypothetical protein